VRDPREGLTRAGTIRTGAALERVPSRFGPVLDAAVDLVRDRAPDATVYIYGSVATDQATIGASDVDLLTIGLADREARGIEDALSEQFAAICRGVEVAAAAATDFVGEGDESYGNRVFLRHYCVLLAGSDAQRPEQDFAGDRRAARGFNGDIERHARRWRSSLASLGWDDVATGVADVAQRVGRKSLLAVAGLVSMHDRTWTTDRETSAHRWAEIAHDQSAGLEQLLSWSSTVPDREIAVVTTDDVAEVLDSTVEPIIEAFRDLIGLWPDSSMGGKRLDATPG